MTSIASLFPSRYWRAADLDDSPVTLTIQSITQVEMDDGTKPAVAFTDSPKLLPLNRTNADFLAAEFGDDIEKMVGQSIVLYKTTTRFKGKQVFCVRLRVEPATGTTTKLVSDDMPF